jgi:hypothetical protein
MQYRHGVPAFVLMAITSDSRIEDRRPGQGSHGNSGRAEARRRVALTDVDNLADGMKVTAGGRAPIRSGRWRPATRNLPT